MFRVEQQDWDSKGPATSAAYRAVVLLDDDGNTLIHLLSSALSLGSRLSTSSPASGERQQQPRVGHPLAPVAMSAARAFWSAADECRGSPSARGRVSVEGLAAIARTTRSHNDSFVQGDEKVAFRRENSATETANVKGQHVLLAPSRDDDDFEMVTRLVLVRAALCISIRDYEFVVLHMRRRCALRSLIGDH